MNDWNDLSAAYAPGEKYPTWYGEMWAWIARLWKGKNSRA
jgi:hypothetical protein